MSICDPEMDDICADESNDSKKNSKAHHVYQKLIIKHNRLTKLSLWGCSGLDVSPFAISRLAFLVIVICFFFFFSDLGYRIKMQALYLNCPELKDLNLTSCRNLHPGHFFVMFDSKRKFCLVIPQASWGLMMVCWFLQKGYFFSVPI